MKKETLKLLGIFIYTIAMVSLGMFFSHLKSTTHITDIQEMMSSCLNATTIVVNIHEGTIICNYLPMNPHGLKIPAPGKHTM